MLKRTALAVLFASMLLVGLAYASAFLPGGAPAWAAWVMSLAIAAMMVAAMTLGATRHGRLGRLVLPFAFVFLVVAGGFMLVLLLPAADPAASEFWFGLPPRAAIVLYGIGLLPLLVVPLAYALTFDEQTLSAADLERVRREALALRRREAGRDDERAAHTAAEVSA
jgi:hypothetical protein